MFTLKQIEAVQDEQHEKPNFPLYVNRLLQLGVLSYEVEVGNGKALYYGADGTCVSSEPAYPQQSIAPNTDRTLFLEKLRAHQHGNTSYFLFCADAAHCGIAKWVVLLAERSCTYFDTQGDILLTEYIPSYG